MVRSEDEDLKIKWAQACRQGELLLIEVLLKNLEKVIAETRSILRDISGQTYKELKKANATEAKQNMEEALKKVNAERKLRTENGKKRKLEAGPSKLVSVCSRINIVSQCIIWDYFSENLVSVCTSQYLSCTLIQTNLAHDLLDVCTTLMFSIVKRLLWLGVGGMGL